MTDEAPVEVLFAALVRIRRAIARREHCRRCGGSGIWIGDHGGSGACGGCDAGNAYWLASAGTVTAAARQLWESAGMGDGEVVRAVSDRRDDLHALAVEISERTG